MKYILIILLISMVAVLGCTPAQDSAESAEDSYEMAADAIEYELGAWSENWDLAMNAAKELKRPVLVNFTGSDWCMWCIRLVNESFQKMNFMSMPKRTSSCSSSISPAKSPNLQSLKSRTKPCKTNLAFRDFLLFCFWTALARKSAVPDINRAAFRAT